MKLFNKVKGLFVDFFAHWNKPKDGEFVSNKEFTMFIAGASGNNTAVGATQGNLFFAAGCFFVGAIYEIEMMDLAMLGLVNMFMGYLFSPINMIITDNLGNPPRKTMRLIHIASLLFLVAGIGIFFIPQKFTEGIMPALPQIVACKFLIQVISNYYNILVLKKLSPKFGKYRSWIVAGIVPFFIGMALIIYFPYNILQYFEKLWVMHLFFIFWGIFGSCLGQLNNLHNVISPNSEERTKIISFGSFVYSLVPSLYGMIFPIFVTMAGGYTSIITYQVVIPIASLILLPLTLFFAFGVKERVVQTQTHKPQVNMRKGFKEVLRNKYLWISNVSAWLGSFSAGIVILVNTMIIYSLRADWAIAITGSILGVACTPGMLLAPWLIKKFGKKRIILITKYACLGIGLFNILAIQLNSLVLIVLFAFLSTLMSMVSNIANQALTGDVWDYQQYISGERLDGCMGIFGYIASPITTLAAYVVPFFYAMVGFTSDWNILFDDTIRSNVYYITIIISSITGLLGIIPWHFYDLTQQKHAEIIEALTERARQEAELTGSNIMALEGNVGAEMHMDTVAKEIMDNTSGIVVDNAPETTESNAINETNSMDNTIADDDNVGGNDNE